MTNAPKNDKCKIYRNFLNFAGKKVQNHVLVCGVLPRDPSARPKKAPLVGTDRRKQLGQKTTKKFQKLNNDKFYENLSKTRVTNNFSFISLSPETIQYLYF